MRLTSRVALLRHNALDCATLDTKGISEKLMSKEIACTVEPCDQQHQPTTPSCSLHPQKTHLRAINKRLIRPWTSSW